MLVRLAGNIFWLARYLERAENTARLLRALQRQSLLPEFTNSTDLFLTALAVVDDLEAFHADSRDDSAHAVLEFMITNRDNPSSVVSCFAAIRENARGARHSLTTGYWEAINTAYLEACKLARDGLPPHGIDEVLDWATHRCQWIRGAADDLLRDEVPQVLSFGQAIERADFTARLVEVMIDALPKVDKVDLQGTGNADYRCWLSLVEAADITETWLRYNHNRKVGRTALRLLIANPHTTRSLLTNAQRLCAACERITGRDDSPTLHAAQELVDHVSGILLEDDVSVEHIEATMRQTVQKIWRVSELFITDHASIPA